MSKILADECVHRDLVDSLEDAGHEVTSVYNSGLSGSSDEEIFNYAVKNDLILLTFDRGFGDIFRFDISESPGIVISLINQMSRDEIVSIILAFFSMSRNLRGKLVIMGKRKIRVIER